MFVWMRVECETVLVMNLKIFITEYKLFLCAITLTQLCFAISQSYNSQKVHNHFYN